MYYINIMTIDGDVLYIIQVPESSIESSLWHTIDYSKVDEIISNLGLNTNYVYYTISMHDIEIKRLTYDKLNEKHFTKV